MEQMVKTYKFRVRKLVLATAARKTFQKDAEKLAKEGWHIVSVDATESAFNPERITVVYEKEG